MRVLIMTDMEGVSGIVAWEQVLGGAREALVSFPAVFADHDQDRDG